MNEGTRVQFGDLVVYQEDERNWVLRRDTGTPSLTKDGTPKGENVMHHLGYYDSLEAALRSALREGMKGQGEIDAKRLLRAIEAAYAGILAAVGTKP